MANNKQPKLHAKCRAASHELATSLTSLQHVTTETHNLVCHIVFGFLLGGWLHNPACLCIFYCRERSEDRDGAIGCSGFGLAGCHLCLFQRCMHELATRAPVCTVVFTWRSGDWHACHLGHGTPCLRHKFLKLVLAFNHLTY